MSQPRVFERRNNLTTMSYTTKTSYCLTGHPITSTRRKHKKTETSPWVGWARPKNDSIYQHTKCFSTKDSHPGQDPQPKKPSHLPTRWRISEKEKNARQGKVKEWSHKVRRCQRTGSLHHPIIPRWNDEKAYKWMWEGNELSKNSPRLELNTQRKDNRRCKISPENSA